VVLPFGMYEVAAGISSDVSRYRHLMKDVMTLLPHSKKESKIEHKEHLYVLNEIAEIRNCDACVFFECRKKRDLFLWFAKTPNGPSAKFLVRNGIVFNRLLNVF
jgi:ribosome biogenesis protein BRX1